MNTFFLLKSIMADLEIYEQSSQGKGTAEDFYSWVAGKKQLLNKDEVDLSFRRSIGRLVVNMYRYSRHYIRKKLNQDAQINFEEFVFLANLNRKEPLTKSELIQLCVQEKTTGMAVINRLVGMNMINPMKDETDKRKTIIRLTEKGLNLTQSYFLQMHDIVSVIGGRLSDDEKMQLLKLLHKLDDFHYDIFSNDHDASVEEIKNKYLGEVAKG